MAFTTLCCKNRQHPDRWACAFAQACRGWLLAVLVVLSGPWARADTPVDLPELKVERLEGDVALTAELRFELPVALEEAMLKGVSLYFVTEVDINRERWYFYDKRVAHAERYVRINYLPLTRRWRVNISPQPFSAGGLGMSLAQTFDNVEDALVAVHRIVQWRVANLADVDSDARHNMELRFRLDLSQLPRPLQMGAVGQSEWNIAVTKTWRLLMEPAK